MTVEKSSNKKRLLIRILAAVVFLAVIHFLLRGPYLSNTIKRVVIPVIEDVTGERVIMDKAVINLFPFYIQGKSIKILGKDGKRLLWVTKSRIYVDLLPMLIKEFRISSLTLKEPSLTATDKEMLEIIEHAKKYTSGSEPGSFGIDLEKIELTDGEYDYVDLASKNFFKGNGLSVDTRIEDVIDLDVNLSNASFKLKDLPGLDYSLKGRFSFDDGQIKISEAILSSSGATIAATGELNLSDEFSIESGSLSGKAMVQSASVNSLFGVKRETDGVLAISGSVGLSSGDDPYIPEFDLDLDAEGHFYLETLMDIIGVDENVKGRIALNGNIAGTFPDISAQGSVNLNNAEFDSLPIDSGLGNIEYHDRRFSLTSFTAHTYDGALSGTAHIDIPDGDFGVTASVSEVDSVRLLSYLGWDAPFRPGKINGDFDLLQIIGQDIDVAAFLNYRNTTPQDDEFIDRINNVEGDLDYRNRIVTINNSQLSSDDTVFSLDGTVDTGNELIDLIVQLDSIDVSDLSSPYFIDIEAPVSFVGALKGGFSGPQITGEALMGAGYINGFPVSNGTADISYRAELLDIETLHINQSDSRFELNGSIEFNDADDLFDFVSPDYTAYTCLVDVDAESLSDALAGGIPLSGKVNGTINFTGSNTDFKGESDMVFEGGEIYGQEYDELRLHASIDQDKVEVKSAVLKRGNSDLSATGKLYFDERFEISAFSDEVSSKDISYLSGRQIDSRLTLQLDGKGTFSKPDIKFHAGIIDSSFSGAEVGGGDISGAIKNSRLTAHGSLLDGRVSMDMNMVVSDPPSWDMDVDFKKGRYDFLAAGLISDPPQDLSVFLEGGINLRSEEGNMSVMSEFPYLSFSLYGYNFRNSGDIVVSLDDDDVEIKSFSLVGKDANVSIGGEVFLGESYNLNLEGDIDLLPLQALTDKVTSLKGRGNFAIDLNGVWDDPEIVGELNVKESMLGLKGFPHKIGPLNGKVFFNKDKLIFDSIESDFAGGKILLFGAGYLERMSFDRLLLSTEMKGINLSPFKGANAAFDGSLFFEASPENSSLTGNIIVNKAQYRRDVDFKELFTGLEDADSITSEETWLDSMLLNIRILGVDDLQIDNNIARTPVKVDLTLTGTVADYGLIGIMEAEEGSVFFRGNEFKILKSSSVDFVEPEKITPVFHIKAETSTGGYRVKLNLDGPLDNFTLSLFSDPHLSEMDILTLLSFGRVSGEGGGVEGGMAASEATSLLTGGIQSEVEAGFKYITGFERFEVEPQSTASGSVSPRVTVGKSFLDNRLSVVYSTSIGTTEEHIIKMEYDLGSNVSIIGSRDEIGSSGADIKYKFEFK